MASMITLKEYIMPILNLFWKTVVITIIFLFIQITKNLL